MEDAKKAKPINIFSSKNAATLTKQQKTIKLAVSWAINVVCIAIIIFSLVVAVIAIIRTTNGGIASIGGKAYMPVKSDSMTGTFEQGDLIVTKVYSGKGGDIKVGQVITFKSSIAFEGDGEYVSFKTHRVVEASQTAGGAWVFTTKGDKKGLGIDDKPVSATDIVATWGSVDAGGKPVDGKVSKGMGKMSNWLQGQDVKKGIIQDAQLGKTRFFCAIVLPLILLFIGYAFILIRTLVIGKLELARKTASEATLHISADSLSEEDKKRLAEEYIASLAAKENESPGAPSDTFDIFEKDDSGTKDVDKK